MESRTYGHARVSAKEQNLDRQMIALQAQGVRCVDGLSGGA